MYDNRNWLNFRTPSEEISENLRYNVTLPHYDSMDGAYEILAVYSHVFIINFKSSVEERSVHDWTFRRLREDLPGKKWSGLYEFYGTVTHPFRPCNFEFSPSPPSPFCISLGSLNQFCQKSGRVVQNANKTDGVGRQDRTNWWEREGEEGMGADEGSVDSDAIQVS